jgi:hypothetical protein
MQVAGGGIERIERKRPHERDYAGVEGNEVEDGAEDARQGDIAATPPRRQGDAGELLGLDAGGDRRIPEQRRGDAEARHGLAQAVPEKLAPDVSTPSRLAADRCAETSILLPEIPSVRLALSLAREA